jgi:hypothetical protein
VVYLVLFIAGLVVDHDSSANFVPVNGAAKAAPRSRGRDDRPRRRIAPHPR